MNFTLGADDTDKFYLISNSMQIKTPENDDVKLFGAMVIPRHATDLALNKVTVANATQTTTTAVFLKMDVCFKEKTTNATDCPATTESIPSNTVNFFLQMETLAINTPDGGWTHLWMDQDLKVDGTCDDGAKMAKCRNY